MTVPGCESEATAWGRKTAVRDLVQGNVHPVSRVFCSEYHPSNIERPGYRWGSRRAPVRIFATLHRACSVATNRAHRRAGRAETVHTILQERAEGPEVPVLL